MIKLLYDDRWFRLWKEAREWPIKPVFKTNTEVQGEEASRSFGGADGLLLVCFANVV